MHMQDRTVSIYSYMGIDKTTKSLLDCECTQLLMKCTQLLMKCILALIASYYAQIIHQLHANCHTIF